MPLIAQRIGIWVMVALVVGLSGCGIFDFLDDAKTATAELFQAINHEEYGAIHESFTADLKAELNASQAQTMFSRVRTEAGVCGDPKVINYSGNSTNTETVVQILAYADCERAAVHADLTWRVEGGVPRLSRFTLLREIATSTSKD